MHVQQLFELHTTARAMNILCEGDNAFKCHPENTTEMQQEPTSIVLHTGQPYQDDVHTCTYPCIATMQVHVGTTFNGPVHVHDFHMKKQ